jgi:hypothetical protein
MEMLYEIGKTVGAISGLFALGLVLWDRYTKHYPVAIIVARPLIDGSRQIVPFLHLKNSSDRPLLVSWSDGDLHKMRVGKGQTLDGILQTLLGGETTISLGPNGDALFPLFKPGAYDIIDVENQIELILRWKFAQPLVWRRVRPLVVSITKRDLDHLIDGYFEREK